MHRGGMCIAVAALMPVPSVMAGEPASQAPSGASSWSTDAYVQTVPSVPFAMDPPPAPKTVGNADGPHQGQRRTASGSDGRRAKTHAVIKASQHERIAEISANTSYDVPLAALNAYRNAASTVASRYPSCHLSWGVIAAIGQVESNHGRFGGAAVLSNGKTVPTIVGLQLNGHGVAAIHDTDNGVLDGDKVWDRAVGPMQFIPEHLGRHGRRRRRRRAPRPQ